MESVGNKMPKWEPAADRGLWALSDPRLSNSSQDEKEVLLWSEELGSISSSLSPSPTHLSHTTNIHPFENKVWEIYFYEEVCSFVHWSRRCVWLCYAYICICIMYTCSILYNTKKVFEKYEDVIRIATSLFFTPTNPGNITRTVIRWIRNVRSTGISYSRYF